MLNPLPHNLTPAQFQAANRQPVARPSAPVIVEFILNGAPRTKKNHGRIIVRGGKRYHVQSIAHEVWHSKAMTELAIVRVGILRRGLLPLPIKKPVHVRAIFYRDRDAGDLVGYQQALGDILENSWIVGNDRQVHSWDGTRLEVDKLAPRIEVQILEYVA